MNQSPKTSTFLLFGQDQTEAEGIESDLKKSLGCKVELTFSAQDAAKRLSLGGVDCLMFDTKTFDMNVLKRLTALRQSRKNLTIVVFANTVSKDIYTFSNMAKMRWTVIIEKPYDRRELSSICEKIARGQDILQRQHNRFTAEQPVHIDRFPTGEKFEGIIRNMSLGGAFIEVQGSLEEGDALKISVRLEPSRDFEVMFAEVVRVESHLGPAGGQTVGVRFVSSEALYSALLARLK